MVQAFDTSEFHENLPNEIRDVNTLGNLKPIRSFKLVGKIIFIQALKGLVSKTDYPELEDAIIVVSSANEVVVVNWSKNIGCQDDSWESKEEGQLPLNREWFRDIDFNTGFDGESHNPKRRSDGIDEKLFLNIDDTTLALNESLQTECEPAHRPKWLLYAWKIHNKDKGGEENLLRSADIDCWTGKPRLAMGGDDCLLRVIDFVEGTPVFAAINRPNDMLNLKRSCNTRSVVFLSAVGETGNIMLVGTDEGVVLGYDPKESEDGPEGVLSVERTPKLVLSATMQENPVQCMGVRPRLIFDQTGKSNYRDAPEGGYSTVGLLLSDNQGNGRLYRMTKRPDTGAFMRGKEYTPPVTQKTESEAIVYRENRMPGIHLFIDETFGFMLETRRGFHPYQGTPKAIAFHSDGKRVAIGSLGQRVWTYETQGVSKRMVHCSYTTTNVTSMTCSPMPWEAPLEGCTPSQEQSRGRN